MTYDLSEIRKWVDQRAAYERDRIENDYRIMRLQTTFLLNMMAKRPLKEHDLFQLPSEKTVSKISDIDMIKEKFAAWDADVKKRKNGQ